MFVYFQEKAALVDLKISEIDLAWAAGFYEGEGWVSFLNTPSMKNPQLRLMVTQKDTVPLYKLKEIFGVGSVYIDQYNLCGRYVITTYNAYRVGKLLLNYIVSPVKRIQLETALKNHEVYKKAKGCDITGGGTCGS